MRDRADWMHALSAEEIQDLEEALTTARAARKPLRALTKRDFPLPRLTSRIQRWRQEIQAGRGFQVVRGIPVKRIGVENSEILFWCLGLHMGFPGEQNPQGDLLGHVIDARARVEGSDARLYQTSETISYHCDAADIVGLLCLCKAKSGGQSRIVSSVAVYNEFLKTAPRWLDRLYEPFDLDTRGEGGLDYFMVPPCRAFGGGVSTFYHGDYFRSAARHERIRARVEDRMEILDLYDQIASSPEMFMEMDLEPGDIQFLSNHTILHARTRYEDNPDPDLRRHLLRLWLSAPVAPSLRTWVFVLREKARLMRSLLRLKLRL